MTNLPPFNSPPPKVDYRPIEEPPTAAAPPQAPPKRRWKGGARSLAGWILRWALLGVGVGGAWLFGILVAQFFPAPEPEAPLQEIAARRTNRFLQKIERLPEWWAGDSAPATPAVNSQVEPIAPPAVTPQPIALTDTQSEQVTVELEDLNAELQQLRDRASAVEQQLGLPTVERPIEERIDSAENRLSPPTESAQTDEQADSEVLQTVTTRIPDPLFQANAYRVTLPSDLLFTPGEAMLQPNAQSLLNSILQDVARYPGATIVVGSYTDLETSGNTPTELSYKQALMVQQYLSQQLGNEAYHWVAVGYGSSTLGSTGGVQLARRVSIAIVP